MLIDKKNWETFIIIVLPGDFRVKDKEAETISKYQDLALEIPRMWNKKTRIILTVIGALGTKLEYFSLIGVMTKKGDSMQQTAALRSAHILRKVLSILA